MITVVSGIPRSGTSMMMQMLVAGGLPGVYQDFKNEQNPNGFFEWKAISDLAKHPEYIAHAEGKCVKVISKLIPYLSSSHYYQVICMHRPLTEVLLSQYKMLDMLGVPMVSREFGDEILMRAFERHEKETGELLMENPNIEALNVYYHEVLEHPVKVSRRICEFLRLDLDVKKMVKCVNPWLYRNRLTPQPR